MSGSDRDRLDDRRALVTGGSKGSGKAVVERLREMGADAYVTARTMPDGYEHPDRFIEADLLTIAGTNAVAARRRPGVVLATEPGACVAGALILTGCSGNGNGKSAGDATGSGTDASAAKPGGAGGEATGTGAVGKEPGATASAGSSGVGKASGAVPVASKSPLSPASSAVGAADDGCDHKMPISPDEVAVYRCTPEGRSLGLIVKHGNWGCATPDSDGAPFETVGKETFIPMDQAAYVTVTNPIVESTENQPIGVQEFLDWLEAHPNSGFVFTCHLGADGAIDRLDEVFTP